MFGDRRLVLATIIVPLLIPVGVLLILFGPMHIRSDGPVVPAAFALGGVAVTAFVSMIGVILNRQADRRLDQGREEERNRLRLDAAMRAGQLLSSEGAHRAAPAAVASGLLALTKLDQVGLAVTLLVDLWTVEDSQVSSETAILVIDAALETNKPTVQLVAAEILCRNSTRLNPCQSLHWPSSVEGTWNTQFSARTKLLIVDALIRMTLGGPANECAFRAVTVRLFGIWETEQLDPRVRGCIGKLLNALIPRLEALGYSIFTQGNRQVTLQQVREAAASAATNPDGFLDHLSTDFANQLQAWAANCTGLPTGPGSLASSQCGTAANI